MVKENCIITSIMKDADADLRDLILNVWGFSNEELAKIRSIADRKDCYEKAALILYSKTSLETLTAMNIAAVASREWNENEAAYCKNYISRHYNKEKMSWSSVNLNVPFIHCLRESIGLYEGNLLEARKYWLNFQASSQDLLRSIKIPEVIDYEVSQLLGVIWGSSFLESPKQGYFIHFNGNPNDWLFFQDWLKPMIEKYFNLPIEINSHKNSDLTCSPRFIISSEAIYTWLRDDVGLIQGEGINVTFPKLKNGYDEKGFLEGLIAATGSNEGTKIKLGNKDEEFIKSFKLLLAKYTPANDHYTPNCNTNNYYFTISKNTLNGLQLINPKYSTP